MQEVEKPYFMSNEEWYTVDFPFGEDGRGYHLTEKAPQEAVDSYNAFYEPKKALVDGVEVVIE